MELLIVLFIVHWLFDYVFQTREIANNKWNNFEKLSQHIMMYTIGLALFAFGYQLYKVFQFNEETLPYSMIFLFIIMNLVFHFLIDFFTSKATHQLWGEKKEHAFFVVLGLDQLLHITALLSTAQWYLGITLK